MQYSKPLFFFALSLFVAYYYGRSSIPVVITGALLNLHHTVQYLTYVIIFSIFFFPILSLEKKVVPASMGSIK